MVSEATQIDLTDAMERELSFLVGLRYEFQGVREHTSEALGTYLVGSFTNAAVNRQVRVVYLPGQNAPRSVIITDIALVVSEPLDEFDYTTLHKIGVCDTYLVRNASLAKCFESHLREAAVTLQERFREELMGRAWKSDHLDWGGLK